MQKIREWFRRHFSNPQVVFLALMLAGGFLTIIFFGRMLAPALTALVLAYLLDGIVTRFEKRRMPRLAAVIGVYSVSMISFALLLVILIPNITTQTERFVTTVLPEIVNDVTVKMEKWNGDYATFRERIEAFIEPAESFTFTDKDILDLPAFVEKLMDPEDPVSGFLRSAFDEFTLQNLAEYDETVSEPAGIGNSIVKTLNDIIEEPSFYEEQRFAGVDLREQTREMLSDESGQTDSVRLNRMLLEDAFPLELARTPVKDSDGNSEKSKDEVADNDTETITPGNQEQTEITGTDELSGTGQSAQLFDIPQITKDLQSWLGQVSGVALKFSLSSIGTVVGILIYMVLVPVLVFFLLKDKQRLLDWFCKFLPKDRALAAGVWRDVNLQTSNYIRGKFWEIIIVWSVTHITFTLFGLKSSLILSLFVGLSVLVPYIGATVMYIPITLVAFYQFEDSPSAIIWILVAYSIIQILDGNVLAPILLSEVTNLHPIAIIMAVLVFGGIWGFWGVFFAIPLATLVNAVINAWPKDLPVSSYPEGPSPPK